ncbi:hypothetical protein ACLM5H_04825 [Fredinandcohnia humi]
MMGLSTEEKQRLEQLRKKFNVKEVNGTRDTFEVLHESVADYINRRKGRTVVKRKCIETYFADTNKVS